MFTFTMLAAFLAASFVAADPVPLEPDSTSVFNEGGNCTILWSVKGPLRVLRGPLSDFHTPGHRIRLESGRRCTLNS